MGVFNRLHHNHFVFTNNAVKTVNCYIYVFLKRHIILYCSKAKATLIIV